MNDNNGSQLRLKGHLLERLDSNNACAHCWHEDKVAMTMLLASVEAASSSTCLWRGRKPEKCRRHHHQAPNIIKHQKVNIIKHHYSYKSNTSPPPPTSLNHTNSQPFNLIPSKKTYWAWQELFVPRQVALVVARILANPCWQPMLLSLHVVPCGSNWCQVPLPIGFHVWYICT